MKDLPQRKLRYGLIKLLRSHKRKQEPVSKQKRLSSLHKNRLEPKQRQKRLPDLQRSRPEPKQRQRCEPGFERKKDSDWRQKQRKRHRELGR